MTLSRQGLYQSDPSLIHKVFLELSIVVRIENLIFRKLPYLPHLYFLELEQKSLRYIGRLLSVLYSLLPGALKWVDQSMTYIISLPTAEIIMSHSS